MVRRGLWHPLTASEQDLIFMKYKGQHHFPSGERTRTQDLRPLVTLNSSEHNIFRVYQLIDIHPTDMPMPINNNVDIDGFHK